MSTSGGELNLTREGQARRTMIQSMFLLKTKIVRVLTLTGARVVLLGAGMEFAGMRTCASSNEDSSFL